MSCNNAQSPAEVDRWLGRLDPRPGPVIPNLVVHKTNAWLADDVAVLAAHRVPAVITSVGSPQPVVGRFHEAGGLVLSDVASMRHAERAISAGTDALASLTARAGRHTGSAYPRAFPPTAARPRDGPM